MTSEWTCPECNGATGPDGWCPECGDGIVPDPDEWDDEGSEPVGAEEERRDAELAAELRGDAKMDHWRDTEEE